MVRIHKGAKNPQRQDAKNRRRVAESASLRDTGMPVASDMSLGGNSAVGSVQRLHQDAPHRQHMADVGHKGLTYDPAYNIARNIQKALDPENPENIVRTPTVTGNPTSGGTTTRGEVTETTERGGSRVCVYGGFVWLKSKWVEDYGDGRVRILHIAYKKSKLLMHLKRRHEARRSKLLGLRGDRNGRTPTT